MSTSLGFPVSFKLERFFFPLFGDPDLFGFVVAGAVVEAGCASPG